MENPEYVLEMQGIVKVFPGVRALDGVNLRVRPGKVHVICGENGAGKSTLMKIINGTYVADEGTMIYKGQQIARVGSTGNSTGNHCHFEVRVNGSAVNPLNYLK